MFGIEFDRVSGIRQPRRDASGQSPNLIYRNASIHFLCVWSEVIANGDWRCRPGGGDVMWVIRERKVCFFLNILYHLIHNFQSPTVGGGALRIPTKHSKFQSMPAAILAPKCSQKCSGLEKVPRRKSCGRGFEKQHLQSTTVGGGALLTHTKFTQIQNPRLSLRCFFKCVRDISFFLKIFDFLALNGTIISQQQQINNNNNEIKGKFATYKK